MRMRTYYFDTKDGVPVRDNTGLEFATSREAIQHSKGLARDMRSKGADQDKGRFIVVVDESGTEIHREPV